MTNFLSYKKFSGNIEKNVRIDMALFANQWETEREITKRTSLDLWSNWFQECSYMFDVGWWGRNRQNGPSDERTDFQAFWKWQATHWLVKRYFQTGKCNLKRKDVSI